MSIFYRQPLNLVFLFILFFTACKKDDLIQPVPRPGNGGQVPVPVRAGVVRFTSTVSLAGEPYHPTNLQAIVTLTDSADREVLKDKALQLTLEGRLTTQPIKLAAGKYKLTAFRLEYGNVNTHFAAPIRGSLKAPEVNRPLAIGFTVGTDSLVSVDLLRVARNDKPEWYGYPSGAFDHGQSNADPFVKIQVRAAIRIGEVLYDSIPASAAISTWDSAGQMTTSYTSLRAGINEIQLLKSASKYELRLSKWGITDQLVLTPADLDGTTVFVLGGSRQARKLRAERVYLQYDGKEEPESRTNYLYNTAGQLSQIEYWLKNASKIPYLSMTETFEYADGKVASVRRIDEVNKVELSVTSFSYTPDGKLQRMRENTGGVLRFADIDYFYEITPQIRIRYDFPGAVDVDNHINFTGGNIISNALVTSNHTSELGNYSYDFNINPYVHMGWPDFQLSHISKNNLRTQQKEYYGTYPTVEPYAFAYNYDDDGYPVTMVKEFRNYQTGKYAFSTLTYFDY